jgi:hypothetical protein
MECEFYKRGKCRFGIKCRKIHCDLNINKYHKTFDNLILCFVKSIEFYDKGSNNMCDHFYNNHLNYCYTFNGTIFYLHIWNMKHYTQECITQDRFLRLYGLESTNKTLQFFQRIKHAYNIYLILRLVYNLNIDISKIIIDRLNVGTYVYVNERL